MSYIGNFFSRSASGAPTARAVTATGSGVVYVVGRLLGSTSALALTSGTNSNLTINGTTGEISSAAMIGANASQTAVVRETNGLIAVEYPVVLTGDATNIAQLTANPTSKSIAANASAGTLLFAISNVPSGVTPTVSPNDGRFVIAGDATNGWKVVTGMSALSAGSVSVTVSAASATSVSVALTITASAVAGASPTSPSGLAPSIQYHPHTAALTMRTDSTFSGYIIPATGANASTLSQLVVTSWSATNSQTIKGGMVLTGGGASAGSTVCHSSGGGAGTYLITGANQTVGSSSAPVTFTAKATQVVAMSDLKGAANLSSIDNNSAPELIVDDYGRKALLFAGETAAYGWLRNLSITGIDTHNIAFFMVGRFVASGKTGNQYPGTLVSLGAYENGSVPTAANILGGGLFPTTANAPFGGLTTATPIATAKRMFLGSQMQVIGACSTTTDGLGGSTTTAQSRLWLNETSYSPVTQTNARVTNATGLTLNAQSKNSGGNYGLPFILYELNGYVLGELGLTSQSQARGDAIVSAMMSNWGISPIARSLVLLGDSRTEYGGGAINSGSPNEATGVTISSLISAPGPTAIPNDVRVISWAAAGEGVGYALGYADQGANNNTAYAPTPMNASWMLGGGKDYFTLLSGTNEGSLWPSTDSNAKGGTASAATNAFVDDYYNGPGYTTTFNAIVSANTNSATATNISPAYIYQGMVFNGTGWSSGAFSANYYANTSSTIILNTQNAAAVSNANTTTGYLGTYQNLMTKLLSRGFKGLWLAEWVRVSPYFNSKVINNALNDAQAGSGQTYANKLLIGNPSLISQGGKFPFAADATNNSLNFFDAIHMNTNGKRLLVYGGDTPQYGYRTNVQSLLSL